MIRERAEKSATLFSGQQLFHLDGRPTQAHQVDREHSGLHVQRFVVGLEYAVHVAVLSKYLAQLESRVDRVFGRQRYVRRIRERSKHRQFQFGRSETVVQLSQ